MRQLTQDWQAGTMPFKKNIVFVGDSFCSCWNEDSVIPHKMAQQKDSDPKNKSWLDLTAEALELNLYSFGFAGRSWYYSRKQLFDHMEYDPEWIESIELMVFCHTNSTRYNSENGDVGNEMLNLDWKPHSDDAKYKYKTTLAKSLQSWAADLIDYSFQDWSQVQWFHEIDRTFKDIKQIHFNNYPFTVEISKSALPGVVFTTPLIHVSFSEGKGTDAEIIKHYMIQDRRCNHFSSYNNRMMSALVVDTYQNYEPGSRPIDLTNFYAPNPNASRWPDPGFGTR